MYYRLKAQGISGGSDWSNTVECTMVPFELVINVSENEVFSEEDFTLNWNDVDASSYTIEEATSSSFNNATSISVSGTIKSFNYYSETQQTYYYRVRAHSGDATSNWSNSVNIVITPPAPSAPVLSEPVVNSNNVTVSWDTVKYATSYTLEVAENSNFTDSNLFEIETTTSKTFSYNISESTTFYYRVKAFGLSGSSVWSNVIELNFIPQPPLVPVLTGPIDEVDSGDNYSLSWSDVGATSYFIEEATHDTFAGAESWEVTDTSKTFIHSVTEETRYYYRVKSANNAGESDWSNIITIDVVNNLLDDLGITMVSIPSGSFQMGSNDGKFYNSPVHKVTLNGFEMSMTEITQEQYKTILEIIPSHFTSEDNLPVEMVRCFDALKF